VTRLDLWIAGAYVAGILLVGFVVSRRLTGFRDFFVAGGRMTTPVLVCTLVSTYYGLDVLFGGSEVGYSEGVVGWFFYARPYYLMVILGAVLVAPRLRSRDALSLPDVAAVYGLGTRAVVAAASFLYSLPLLALMGVGVLLDVLFGVPFATGVMAGAVVSVAYTLMGGLRADALTDTVQFVLMCVTLGVAAALVLDGGAGVAGGVDGLRRALPSSYFDATGSYPLPVLLVFGLGALSVLVEPAFYQRMIAARSLAAIAWALAIGLALWAAFDWIVTLLGMAARARGLDVEPRYALLTLVLDVLPPGLTGLFVAGVVATAMSTIDSYLLIAGGNLAYDLYRPVSGRSLDDADLLRLTRVGIVIACLVSVALALAFRSIVSAWVFMATVLVAAALVPVLAALFLRSPRPVAGLASSLTGLTVVLTGYTLIAWRGIDDPDWGTRIWSVAIAGREIRIWQEYVILAALPASVVAFAVGQRWGPPGPKGSTTLPGHSS
jgi:SSS family solute:Na+ symporter